MSVTVPRGFRAAGVAAGLKSSGAADVALVINDGPDAGVAGVFTANRVKAAPVLWSQQVVHGGVVRAVVLNSGGANACTGPAGFQDTHATAEHTAAAITAANARLIVGAGEVAGPVEGPLTRLQETERREAHTALRWACAELDLPEPLTREDFLPSGPWRP